MKRILQILRKANKNFNHNIQLFVFGVSANNKHSTKSSAMASVSGKSGKRKSDKMEDQEVEVRAPAEKKIIQGDGKSQPVPSGPPPTPASTSTMGGASALPPNGNQSVTLPSNDDFQTLCDEMSQVLTDKAGGEGNSYSAKLRAPRKVYPYALYILAAEAARENLDMAHFNGFQDFIFHQRIKLAFEDNQRLIIDWMIHKSSYGVAACGSKDTALWMKAQAAAFKHQEKGTKCIFQWERQAAILYSFFLQGQMWKNKAMKPNFVLSKILAANGLRGEFRSVSYDTKSNSKGVFLEFEAVSDELKTGLDQKSWLNCFTCNPILRKRERKMRTEKEFLKLINKDSEDKE